MRACPAGPDLPVQNMTGGVVGIPPPTGRAIRVRNGAKPGLICRLSSGWQCLAFTPTLELATGQGAPVSATACCVDGCTARSSRGAERVCVADRADLRSAGAGVDHSRALQARDTILCQQNSFRSIAAGLCRPSLSAHYTRWARVLHTGCVPCTAARRRRSVAGSVTAPCKRPNGSRP